MSQINRYPSLNQPIESLVGNDGIVVPPIFDGIRWDVFVLGAGHIFTTGDIALGTLTINLDGGIADLYPTDAGVANPIGGVLNIFGGSNINTAAPVIPGNSVIINLNDNVHITGTFIADGDITSTAGDISATLGFLNAGTTVTAGTGITSTTGDIVASTGDISATLGSLNAGTTVTAGTGITATTGDITATTGDIHAVAGDIIASLGSVQVNTFVDAGTYVQAGTTVTAGTGITSTTGNITATLGNMVITAGNLNLPDTNGTGTEGTITLGGSIFLQNYGTFNTFVGTDAGNLTLTVANAEKNSAFGYNALKRVSTGSNNSAFGDSSQLFVNSGSFNTAFGQGSLIGLTTGSYNSCFGYGSGAAYNAAQSSNVCIASIGDAADNNTIRIGTQGAGNDQQDRCFIAGIRGVSPAATDAGVALIASDHQLGSLGSMTDGQLVIGSTGLNPVLGNITSTYLTVTDGAGTINIETKAVLQNDTGWESWGGAGNYFDDTVLGSFTILRPGTGFINGLPVAWVAPQTVVGMVAGNTYYIYVDNTGTLQLTNVRTDALYQDNVVLFECMRDSTLPTNNQFTVKENHPYGFPVESSNYLHNVVSTVIDNQANGANITLVGTQGIGISGADILNDHGVTTVITDSGGVGVVWSKYYTDAGGDWALQNSTNTFTGFWNNGGVPTALTANRFGVYTLYATKDNLTSALPQYFAVLNTAQFNSAVAANTAIANGTIARATGELAQLEIVQLGYIVYRESTAAITVVTISKTTLRQTLSTGGTNTASLVVTDTTNFNNILSAADTNVQSALNTLDNLQVARWSVETVNLAGVVNHGYLADKAGRLDVSLPAVSAIGDIIRIVNVGATAIGWRITQGAGQQIWIGNTFSTAGVGGYIEATAIGDAIELVCYIPDLSWIATSAPQGNITVV